MHTSRLVRQLTLPAGCSTANPPACTHTFRVPTRLPNNTPGAHTPLSLRPAASGSLGTWHNSSARFPPPPLRPSPVHTGLPFSAAASVKTTPAPTTEPTAEGKLEGLLHAQLGQGHPARHRVVAARRAHPQAHPLTLLIPDI